MTERDPDQEMIARWRDRWPAWGNEPDQETSWTLSGGTDEPAGDDDPEAARYWTPAEREDE